MKLPSGMTTSSPHDVCKLRRSLYGLKQAPRALFEKFHSTLLSFSFTQSQYDSSLFLHTCKTLENSNFLKKSKTVISFKK